MSRLRLLVVDDDDAFLKRFTLLGGDEFDVRPAASAEEAMRVARTEDPDAVLLDVDLGGGENGIDLLVRLRAEDPDLPVVMVTADDRHETVVRAMRAGANDYVPKHPDLEILKLKLTRALEDAALRAQVREQHAEAIAGLVGSAEPMARLRETIHRVASRQVRVLIRGESGTGKELVARAIHAAGSRQDRPFVPVNGASGPTELFDAEMFGHERAAFTGANCRRRGHLEAVSGGTLFLDEVGKMGLDRQAKLLRVVETGRFRRLGSNDELECDVRWIAASNEDLDTAVRERRFLPDLLFRLAEYTIDMPPLRERASDIPDIARHLLGRFAAAEQLPAGELDPAALDLLTRQPWPGNVRELDSVVKRATLLSERRIIGREAVARAIEMGGAPAKVEGVVVPALPPDATFEAFFGDDYFEAQERVRVAFGRTLAERALAKEDGNVTQAARRLRVSRATFYRILEDVGLKGKGGGQE